MSLRWYRRPRLVALNPDAPVLEAARAMEKNEIGAVVILRDGELVGLVTDRDLAVRALGQSLDPAKTPLSQVMTSHVATLPSTATREEAVALMCHQKVRRIPLVEDGNLVGIVTLDDLILDESIPYDQVSEVVEAQLGQGGPAPSERAPAKMRSAARAESTYRNFMGHLQYAASLDSLELTETAAEVVLGCILQRLVPGEANHFIAQLPSLLQPRLQPYANGPNTEITRDSIVTELVRRLDVSPERAAQLLEVIGFESLIQVSEGQADDVQRQLPQDIRDAILAPSSP